MILYVVTFVFSASIPEGVGGHSLPPSLSPFVPFSVSARPLALRFILNSVAEDDLELGACTPCAQFY